MIRFAVIVVFLVNISVVIAQDAAPLRFDVASVKPTGVTMPPGPPQGGVMRYRLLPAGGLQGTITLEWLIATAYEIMPVTRIIGGPGWVRTQVFDVDVRPGGKATTAETRAMLRTLLEERFGLVWRRDPNGKATVYTLVMANDAQRLGPGLRRAEMECVKGDKTVRPLRGGQSVPCGVNFEGDRTTAGGNVPFQLLVSAVSISLGQEVVDRTALTGNFDFYLQLPPRGQPIDQQDVSIFTAVQEQLGLKLQREEITRDVFIVEKASQPAPN